MPFRVPPKAGGSGSDEFLRNRLSKFDPARADPRNPVMLHSATDLTAMRPSPVPFLRASQGRGTESGEALVEAGTARQGDKPWVDEMARVRDARDRAAFAALFGHFAPRVKAFLIKSGAEPSVAEDCAQDVMVTVWRKAHLFDPSRASVATWVFTIARNRRIDLLRRDRRPEPEQFDWGPAPEPDQEDILGLQQDSTRLGQAIAALPAKQKDLIEKAYYGDLSHREIAEITGLPLGTIKSRIRLALDRLRHAMGT